ACLPIALSRFSESGTETGQIGRSARPSFETSSDTLDVSTTTYAHRVRLAGLSKRIRNPSLYPPELRARCTAMKFNRIRRAFHYHTRHGRDRQTWAVSARSTAPLLRRHQVPRDHARQQRVQCVTADTSLREHLVAVIAKLCRQRLQTVRNVESTLLA